MPIGVLNDMVVNQTDKDSAMAGASSKSDELDSPGVARAQKMVDSYTEGPLIGGFYILINNSITFFVYCNQ